MLSRRDKCNFDGPEDYCPDRRVSKNAQITEESTNTDTVKSNSICTHGMPNSKEMKRKWWTCWYASLAPAEAVDSQDQQDRVRV